METFGFHSYHRTSASALALRGYQYEIQSLYGKPCALVVDVGYSWITVTPIYNYVPVAAAVRRIDVGGKVMSNWLAELVSYRHINMYDDVYLVNDMKEKLCHVSADVVADLRLAGRHKKLNHLTRQYLLPNHITTHSGTVLPNTNTTTTTIHHPPPTSPLRAATTWSSPCLTSAWPCRSCCFIRATWGWSRAGWVPPSLRASPHAPTTCTHYCTSTS